MSVYFIQAPDGSVKIGVANNPHARLCDLQVGHPGLLRLARVIDGDEQAERWLHRRFKSQHIRGEWFAFTPDMETVRPPDFVRPPPQRAPRARYRSLKAFLASAEKLGLYSPEEVA